MTLSDWLAADGFETAIGLICIALAIGIGPGLNYWINKGE